VDDFEREGTQKQVTSAWRPAPVSIRARRVVTALGCAGAVLGVGAGVVQLVCGSSIPEWTGDKMDTTGLGLVTIGLSLVAGVALWLLVRCAGLWTRLACGLVALTCAVLCFTTVGRLWYVPGPLLILATIVGGWATLRSARGEDGR
jgi:uncharacterized membrane protein